MSLTRLRTSYAFLPCNCYHSLSTSFPSPSHSPYSPYASTSATTLDDPPPPAWNALTPEPISGGRAQTSRRGKDDQEAVRRRQRMETLPSAAAEKGRAEHGALSKVPRQPPSDRTQISPFLPLVTRERNHLLSTLRGALYSRSSFPSRSDGKRIIRTKREAWDPNAVWVALAKVLRYPEEIPHLPHSHFPSSTRAPASIYDDDADLAPRSPFTAEDGGFFSSAHPSSPSSFPTSSAPSSAFPPAHPLSPSPTDRPDGRHPISLTLPELKRAFTILSTSRPRTRDGLSRLLVVAELIARHKGAVMVEEGAGARDGGDKGAAVTRLRGGGKGLDEKDWAQLLLFAGAAMRTTRPEPDMQSVLGLYGQYLVQEKEAELQRGKKEKALSPAHPQRLVSRKKRRAKPLLYNALLHLAARAKMYDLFEQVRAKMRDEGVGGGGGVAQSVIELGKAATMGYSVQALWEVFEGAVVAAEAQAHRGEAQGGDLAVLWAAMAWWLAQRGHLDDSQRLYDAMKAQKVVELRSLRPSSVVEDQVDQVHPPPSSAPFAVLPPPLLYSSFVASVQARCFRGDIDGALQVLKEVLSGADTRILPSVHLFNPFFRMFARFGTPSTGGAREGGLSRTLLSGAQVSAYASSSRFASSAHSTLSSSLSASPAPSSASRQGAAPALTLSALHSIFDLYLSLNAPISSTHPSLPFSGTRTAPSAKEIYWVLSAFDRLSGGDSALVIEVYGLLVGKFRDKESEGWTGWRMDKRVSKLVRGHVEKIEELQKQWEELQ
ncbi:hypothetical protein JCM11251_005523 [Rhodosporidiobolus azoricus]